MHKNSSLVHILSCFSQKTSIFLYILCKKRLNQCDYYDDASQNDPVVAEYFKVMLLDIAHQELDRYDRQAKGYQLSLIHILYSELGCQIQLLVYHLDSHLPKPVRAHGGQFLPFESDGA